jgi:hypothetical protein
MTAVATGTFMVVLIVPAAADCSYPQIALEQNWYVPNFWTAAASLMHSQSPLQAGRVPLP